MRFADDRERERYWRLREQPEMREATGMGRWGAETYVLPRIYGNDGVLSSRQLGDMTKRFLEAIYVDAATHHGRELTVDEAFMLRMGFQAVTLDALESNERVRRAGEKLGEGLALALAGIEACNAGLALLGDVKPPGPPVAPAPHALGLNGKRPLRSEDFGALPLPPRS